MNNAISQDLGYVMPQSVELENGIIAALIESEYSQNVIFSNLIAEDFYKQSNKLIFEAALQLRKEGNPIDNISLFQKLKENNNLELVGGMQYIVLLQSQLTSTANLEYHVLLLKDTSNARKAIELMHSTIGEFYQNKSSREIIPTLINEFELILSRTSSNKNKTFKESYIETIKNIGSNNGSDQVGLSTGFRSLDYMTSGLCAPDLTILAAGPGEGKSTFALNIAINVAMSAGKVLFFSYEMKEEQLIYKIISNETNTEVLNVRKGKLQNGFERHCKAFDAKLKIYDGGEYSIDQIISLSKFENIAETVKLIVIDYLQLIPIGIYGQRGQTRNDQIGLISRKLKQLAMALNVPVICLSQINRDKHRKTYVLADLRDSGEIEQNADNVWFIWRPPIHRQDSYTISEKEIEISDQTTILIIEKNRLGKTGEFEMKFNAPYSRFEDLTPNNVTSTNFQEPTFPAGSSNEGLPF